ncbi:MAG: hypothetical protein LIR46_00175 [Bacteroidota bacterium]|nr:hypothetical protein [Bacteroidota bacterium]
MANDRLELHELLCQVLGSRNVYFQPPETVKMKYPAIVYSRNRIENTSADNIIYRQSVSYMIMVIDRDPDSEIVERISQIPHIMYDRGYVSDNLNHDVFRLFV